MPDTASILESAVREGKLLAASRDHIVHLLGQAKSPVVAESLSELIEGGNWDELNDRFFQTLAFGTGGLRGRTIGRKVTHAELGQPDALGRPQFPCTGTNAMNFFNISRATRGLAAYAKEWFAAAGVPGRASIVIAHDTRHFSREFAGFAAKVAKENGLDVFLFEGPRSTPELSFAVRATGATAGVVLTASHNPPHDNGFKAYFADGAQVVEPHAGAIISRVNAIESDEYDALPAGEQGTIRPLGREIDDAYMDRLETLVLQPGMVRAQSALKVVFTAIHGTGGVISVPMLRRLGFSCITVPEQDAHDGRFPTVKSPNPENAEALAMGLALATKEGADLVIGTDPDCDRMGVAARNAAGEMQLLTGNQIGSLMAWYRTTTLLGQGVLHTGNLGHAAIIKTFVTTDLQKAIAQKAGIRCVETLTGFKYIGAKLGKYEDAIPQDLRRGYARLPEDITRALRLEHSTFYVFGGEESYGYSGCDFVRDKDGNGAVVMIAEVAAYAKSRGMTLDQLLDEIYSTHGFYLEKNGNLVFEGAEGASKIQRLAESYAMRPPAEVNGRRVASFTNFAEEEVRDVEGDIIPKEKMLMATLADGGRFAVRPSGTEPKIKYYLFEKVEPAAGTQFSAQQLATIKSTVQASLDTLWDWLQKDADQRLK